jgi:hypothetical protein
MKIIWSSCMIPTKRFKWCQKVSTNTFGWSTLHSQGRATYHKVSCIKIDPCSKVLSANFFVNLSLFTFQELWLIWFIYIKFWKICFVSLFVHVDLSLKYWGNIFNYKYCSIVIIVIIEIMWSIFVVLGIRIYKNHRNHVARMQAFRSNHLQTSLCP